jgi:hypothetical protein
MPSQDSVQSAVDQLIPQTLSLAKIGGKVDQEKAFTELREITLTILALDPNAILHLIRIARDRVLAATKEEYALAVVIRDALANLDTGPVTAKIRSTEALGDAGAALTNLQADISSGFVSSDNITNSKAAIDSFLNAQIAQNVKSGGSEIVTKDEAIRVLRANIDPLVEAHAETLRLLTQLELIFSEFASEDIRVLVGNSVVEESRNILNRIQEFSDFSPLVSAGQSSVHLSDLAAIKRLLTSYFEAPDPLDPRLASAVTNSFKAILTGEGTPAEVTSTTVVRPLVTIETGASVFDVTANGTPTSINLITEGITSLPATMYGSQSGTFNIVALTNDIFYVAFNQSAPTAVPLTAGAARTRAQIAFDINAAVGSTVAFDSVFQGTPVILLQSTVNGRNSHVLIDTGVQDASGTLGFTPGALTSGDDPDLDEITFALNTAQNEYSADSIPASPATTTLVSTSTGVISNGILTDAFVVSFLTSGVHGGDLIPFTSGPNKGRLLKVLRVVALQIHLAGADDDTAISYAITKSNQQVKLTSMDNTTISALDVDSGNANTNLGFSGAETAVGTYPLAQIRQQTPVPSVAVDTALYSVVPGDAITITGSGTFTIVALESLSGEPVLRLTPEVSFFATPADFSIVSFGATSFEAFIDEPIDQSNPLPNFIHNTLTVNGYDTNLRVLEEAVAGAINDPSSAAAAEVLAQDLVDILDSVTGLQFILAGYTAAEINSVGLVLSALEEHNFDRFLQLLTEGFISDTLDVTVDDFSFTSQLQTAAREVNTGDLRVQ